MSPLPLRKDVPPHTRLILASDKLLETWGARSEEGFRISAEWGEEKPEGWYEPTFSLHFDDDLREDERKATVERIRKKVDDLYGGIPEADGDYAIGYDDAKYKVLDILEAEVTA